MAAVRSEKAPSLLLTLAQLKELLRPAALLDRPAER
jgi:hypothetical protein